MNEVSGLCDQAVKDARLLVCTPIALVHAPFRTLRPGQSPCTGDCPSPVSDPGCRVALSGSADTTPEPSGPQQPARASDSRPGAAARRSGAPSRGVIWGVRVLLTSRRILTVVGSLRDLGQPPGAGCQQLVEDKHELLQNSAIRTQMAGYLVQQLYANVDVSAELSARFRLVCSRWPVRRGRAARTSPRRRRSASRATAGAERLERGEPADRPAVHQHRRGQLEGRKAHRQRGLHRPSAGPRSADERSRLAGLAAGQLPPSAARLKVMTSNQISTVQTAVKILKGLAVILPAGRVPAVRARYLPVRGRRRHALFVVGHRPRDRGSDRVDRSQPRRTCDRQLARLDRFGQACGASGVVDRDRDAERYRPIDDHHRLGRDACGRSGRSATPGGGDSSCRRALVARAPHRCLRNRSCRASADRPLGAHPGDCGCRSRS